MSKTLAAAPRTQRRWWLLAVPVIVGTAVVVGIALLAGSGEPGKRTRFVLPSGTSSAAFKSVGAKLEVAPDLRDDIQAELGAMIGSMDQTLFLCRETSQCEISITSVKPMQSSAIRYTLLDGAGDEISAGMLWPLVELQPNVKTQLLIGDFELGRATRVVLSKGE